MAALPYIQLYVSDYLADTAHLSTLENGAYLLLIFNYWQRGESFKAKDQQTLNKRLASVARLSNEEWENIKETLAEFFEINETEWKHTRIDRDLDAVNSKSEKAREAGKASAASKSNERSTSVQQTFNHTDTDTDTDKNNTSPSARESSFADFWKAYPKKIGKGSAENAWKKIKSPVDTLALILPALEIQKRSDQWRKDNGQFIPNPSTYLNQRRWEDEESMPNSPALTQSEKTMAFMRRISGVSS